VSTNSGEAQIEALCASIPTVVVIISDAGLPAYCELDDTLRLTDRLPIR
jgi:hypothetical protein